MTSTGLPEDIREGPQGLRSAAALTLDSLHPSCLVRGDARADIGNEPFKELIRSHSAAGSGGNSADWRRLWPAAVAALKKALAGEASCAQEASWHHAGHAPRRRHLSFSAVPVRDESGEACAALVTVFDISPAMELARVERDLDALNYTLSHDLQSPIRTLQELTRILVEGDVSTLPDETRAFLGHLDIGAAKLAQRVDGLVRVTRVTRKPLECRTVDVAKLVDSIGRRLARARPGTAVEYITGALPGVVGDEELLGQAFEAVLSNAFKFTRDVGQPRVEIGARHELDQIVYSIADNGAGFDMRYAGRLFGLFQRLHNEAEFEGTGVGLALARRIVERHGGSVQGTAVRQQGATFSIALPA